MAALLIFTIILFIGQSLAVKMIKAETLSGRLLVNCVFCTIAAAIMLLASAFTPLLASISTQTIALGILFGLLFMLTILAYNLAMARGPLAYTAFYMSASMLISSICGVAIFKEPVSAALITATALFLAAFYLLNVGDSKAKTGNNAGWLVLCGITFVCNGLLSVVQKGHQTIMQGKESSALMLVGFLSAACFYLAAFLFANKKRPRISLKAGAELLKVNITSIVLMTAASLGGNLLLTWLSGRMNGSYLFPLVQGSIVLGVALISVFVYKENLSLRGRLGLGLGVAAVIIINLK